MTNTTKCGKIQVENGKAKCPICKVGKLITGGIGQDTVIQHLRCKCSHCKREIEVNIAPEPASCTSA